MVNIVAYYLHDFLFPFLLNVVLNVFNYSRIFALASSLSRFWSFEGLRFVFSRVCRLPVFGRFRLISRFVLAFLELIYHTLPAFITSFQSTQILRQFVLNSR